MLKSILQPLHTSNASSDMQNNKNSFREKLQVPVHTDWTPSLMSCDMFQAKHRKLTAPLKFQVNYKTQSPTAQLNFKCNRNTTIDSSTDIQMQNKKNHSFTSSTFIRAHCSSVSAALRYFVKTSAGFSSPFILTTFNLLRHIASCNQRSLTSICRIRPSPLCEAKLFAVDESVCTKMFFRNPNSRIML